jgi:two-component system sensor histidine kinase VicK
MRNSVSPMLMTVSKIIRSIADRTHHLYFVYDLGAGKFIYINPAMAAFFSMPQKKIDGDFLSQLIHPDDQEYLTLKYNDFVIGKTFADVECRFVIDGKQRWLCIQPFLENENSKHLLLIGSAEDITAYKELNSVLQKHNIKKNSILNILTHDLAGPIGTVQNITTVLQKETHELDNPRVAKFLAMISNISKSNIKLIREFVNQEFLESAGVKLIKRRVELIESVRNLTENYIAMQSELAIEIIVNSNQEKIYAEIDEDKFFQVINNLFSNALKFTPKDGRITISIIQKDSSVLISVADNGIGIPEQYHGSLFNKFTDARRTGLHGEHSTGLGMSIIKTIVEWHDAKIWFESETNKGTTFFIELPVNN